MINCFATDSPPVAEILLLFQLESLIVLQKRINLFKTKFEM